MAFKAIFGVLLLALLLPLAYERRQAVYLFYKNAPHRITKVNTFASHEIKFSDRIRSCEDALMVESEGVAILACDPGRERWNTVMGIFLPGPVESGKLYIYDYTNPGASDSEALKTVEFIDFPHSSDFHTLGLAYHEGTSTLFVASHRHDYPAIEMFQLDLQASTATYLRSIQHPLIHGPNSIALVNDHEFYVTNSAHFLARDNPVLNKLEINLNLPGGSIVHVDISPQLKDPSASPEAHIVARIGFANGIEFLNASTLAVSSSSGAKVRLYSITHPDSPTSPPNLTPMKDISAPFCPDNLSVSKDGALLIAGHAHVPSLGKFAHSRHICNSEEELANADEEMRETCKTLTAPSWAARWTEDGGLETLYAGVEYPTSATAARDLGRKVGILAGLYARGILVWRE
ncbi:putative paraoxonase [Nemania sp. FL0916]|nr:putative paraoxonase [Nemania sp. FL0916]